jgi:hypothetical protein
MTLTGILKNILLVLVSVMIWSTQITMQQTVGYAIALLGLVYYSLGYDQLVNLFHTGAAQTAKWWETRSSQGSGWFCLKTRRVVITALLMAGLISLSPRLWHYHRYEQVRI